MSKWINVEKAQEFMDAIKLDNEKKSVNENNVFGLRWATPEKGTKDAPAIYEIRFLPDPKQKFRKRIFYHMFKVGDSWKYSLCPKTHDLGAYCPICAVTSKLYATGVEEDKKEARNYKRKEKYICNIFVVNDPRDAKAQKDEDKVSGTVRLYEYPSKIDQLLKAEIEDVSDGRGMKIFDPSSDGYNFKLKVGATAPQADNKTWSDYSTSTFLVKPCALGTDDEIDDILSKTYDLDEYLNAFDKGDAVIEWLKQNLVYELIENDYEMRGSVNTSTTRESSKPVENKTHEDSSEAPGEVSNEDLNSSNDMSDEDILAELSKIK